MPPFTVHSIRLPPEETVFDDTVQQEIPHLHQFLKHVAEIQSGEEEPYGRRYQLETIHKGVLQLPSPYTGEAARATRSFYVSGKIFYWFNESPDFFVASSRVSRGYPLAALILPATQRMVRWEPLGSRGLDQHHLEKIMNQRAKVAQTRVNGSTPVAAVMGNRNFAHHLWNELSALDRLLTRGGPGLLSEIFIKHEPLGKIESIFPEIAHLAVHRTPRESTHDALYVNLGSYCVSKSMRERLLQHARREASSETKVLMAQITANGGPVFWLSVRMANPTLTNQREVIGTICRRLLKSNTRCTIVIDGFSLPEDWRAAGDTLAASYAASAAASRTEIEAIIGQLSNTPRPSTQLVVNAGGIGILDSIALAELADVYFCHNGSIQHKIGWTANKPGIIHGPKYAMAKDPVSWHTERVEKAVPPLPLPVAMIQDVESELREKNYKARSAAVAQFVVNYFSWHVRR